MVADMMMMVKMMVSEMIRQLGVQGLKNNVQGTGTRARHATMTEYQTVAAEEGARGKRARHRKKGGHAPHVGTRSPQAPSYVGRWGWVPTSTVVCGEV